MKMSLRLFFLWFWMPVGNSFKEETRILLTGSVNYELMVAVTHFLSHKWKLIKLSGS